MRILARRQGLSCGRRHNRTGKQLRRIFRNMPPVALAVLLPFHFLLTVALILRAGARKELRPTLRGLRDAFFTGQLFAGRKGIQARRTVSSWQIMQAFSWSPLRVLGKKPDVRPLKIKDQ